MRFLHKKFVIPRECPTVFWRFQGHKLATKTVNTIAKTYLKDFVLQLDCFVSVPPLLHLLFLMRILSMINKPEVFQVSLDSRHLRGGREPQEFGKQDKENPTL